MAERMKPDEMWYWYENIEDFKKSGMGQAKYCRENNLDYSKFCNMYYRIIFKSVSNPKENERLIHLGRKYLRSDILAERFTKDNGINRSILSEVCAHIRYIDMIAEIKAQKNESEKPMNFIQVPTIPISKGGSPNLISQEPEVVEKQNDLEIIITKGVKVTISPNIDSMKIIKIIEFLKDL